MKTITLSFILLVVATFAKAQISLIPKAGINISSVSFAEDTYESRKSLVGFTAGLGINYSLSGDNFLSIQPEILYSQKGFSASESGLINYDGNYRLNYVELPILLKVNFGTEQISVYVNAGPSFGYLLNGRVKGTGNILGMVGDSIDESIEFTETPSTTNIAELDANRFEIGANFGGGIGYNFGENSNLFLDARYNLGLTDFDNTQQSRNRVIALTAGVQFSF